MQKQLLFTKTYRNKPFTLSKRSCLFPPRTPRPGERIKNRQRVENTRHLEGAWCFYLYLRLSRLGVFAPLRETPFSARAAPLREDKINAHIVCF